MKKLFKVLSNILSFGVPLFIELLSKARKFDELTTDNLELVSISKDKVLIRSEHLEIDLAIRAHSVSVDEEASGLPSNQGGNNNGKTENQRHQDN